MIGKTSNDIKAARFGFLPVPGDPIRFYCAKCYRTLAFPRVADMRAHRESLSACSWRQADGSAQRDRERLGV